MYTITLTDGTKIECTGMNGTNYISAKKVDESIFTEANLATVEVSDGETKEIHERWIFIQQMKWEDGTYYLAFRDRTENENLLERLAAAEEALQEIIMGE